MAYDEKLVTQIRKILTADEGVVEKKMYVQTWDMRGINFSQTLPKKQLYAAPSLKKLDK